MTLSNGLKYHPPSWQLQLMVIYKNVTT